MSTIFVFNSGALEDTTITLIELANKFSKMVDFVR